MAGFYCAHIFYMCYPSAIGNCRYVWFDELFTFDIARTTSRKQFWYRELKFDCNPPSVYLLSRVSMAILGPSPLGLRFPSMVESYCGSVAILLLQQAGFPITARVEPHASFVSRHRQFSLLGRSTQWLFTKLHLSGAIIALVGDYNGAMPYLDTTLYLVTMPSQ